MQLPVEDGGQAGAGADVEISKGFVAPGLAVDQTVQVELVPGILDPAAPAGGMEYNLRQAGTKR